MSANSWIVWVLYFEAAWIYRAALLTVSGLLILKKSGHLKFARHVLNYPQDGINTDKQIKLVFLALWKAVRKVHL